MRPQQTSKTKTPKAKLVPTGGLSSLVVAHRHYPGGWKPSRNAPHMGAKQRAKAAKRATTLPSAD